MNIETEWTYSEKTRAEDNNHEYQSSHAKRYAYSILLTATKLQTTNTTCGIIKIVHLISYSKAFVYNLIRI